MFCNLGSRADMPKLVPPKSVWEPILAEKLVPGQFWLQNQSPWTNFDSQNWSLLPKMVPMHNITESLYPAPVHVSILIIYTTTYRAGAQTVIYKVLK